MTDLDFYADVILSDGVLGARAGNTHSHIERALGSDFLDDVKKGVMRRDYGLVEFGFNRVFQEWICFGFSVQVHRLASIGADKIVPKSLAVRYGRFRTEVKLFDIVECLRSRGCAREVVHERSEVDCSYFHVEGLRTKIIVRKNESDISPPSAVVGSVWSIHSS